MDLLLLVAALLLPWAVGALLLRYATTRGAAPSAGAALLLGYGLFIGYQLLYLLLRASGALLGQVSVPTVMAALVLVGAALLTLVRRQPRTAPAAAVAEDGVPARAATIALAFLATLHLAYAAVEVLHLPVFPWDAWASWLYRAKTWFLAGDFVTIADPREWRTDASLTYSVIASEYPGFLPAIAMWCALALGRWSETLVNLPTLACGAALALALYGQCRAWGLPRWTGALGAYLLLSLPLIGTHLSLGGYADIWMAGYAGLGLLALLVGIVREDRRQLLLGFLLLALGMAVKREGGVWLLVGAGMVALAVLPRRWLLAGVIALLAVAGALSLLGLGTIPVPGLGRVGIADNALHVPALGAFELRPYPLWQSYFDNLFAGDSWHLLWTLVLIAAAALPLLPAGRLRRGVGAFFIASLLTQLLLFQVTELGRWVETGTVVNRVPLQMAPALLFALLITGQALWQRFGSANARPSGIVIGGALLCAAALLALRIGLSAGGNDGEARAFDADTLQAVVGSAERSDGTLRVTGFSDGIAILSSGQLSLDTADFDVLYLRSGGNSTRQLTVFWRSAADPAQLHSLNVERPGNHWIDLGAVPEWDGDVMEVGVVAYADGERVVTVSGLELLPASATVQWRRLYADWRAHSFWSQRSVNAVRSASAQSLLPLPLLAAAFVLAALVFALVLRRRPGAPSALALCALLAWLLLDARWLLNRAAQAAQTSAGYPLLTASHLNFGDDALTRDVAAEVAPLLGPGTRTVVLSELGSMDFAIRRAKYFALPAAAYAYTRSRNPPLEHADYLWVLREYPAPPGYRPQPPAHWLALARQRDRAGEVILENDRTLLIALRPAESPP